MTTNEQDRGGQACPVKRHIFCDYCKTQHELVPLAGVTVEPSALRGLIEQHIPLESAAGEPGDAGCSCDQPFAEYTWKGYCQHLTDAIVAALSAEQPKSASGQTEKQ